jgi:type II secretory pathway component PulK
VGGPASRRNEQGMAVVIVITLLAILLIFVAGNIRTLHLLNRELKLLEKRQIQRLQTTTLQSSSLSNTNQPPAQTNSPSR